ncbi:DUF805 domain-containing protein [Paucibacter sp. DJ1R-11]|uniref:DUF805 domain-containing protein n=1 Tax=Paucibacter sp. DJ1R-11 TaxID=2893556 RepID=UPI0021E416AF|nr:DUF805 domain-containing protein [Paucibacter sp. DJ1R-11]MCV2363306.1 DUF805 domain-containing protein [Paucibacter sp. DJ1R-11]
MQLLWEFSTAGRLGRGGFWLRHLTVLPVGLWLLVSVEEIAGSPFDLIASAILLLMLVSIWGRRLHDRGHSAWWILLVAVPVVGALLLLGECGLRGTSEHAKRFGSRCSQHLDYFTVQTDRPRSTQA